MHFSRLSRSPLLVAILAVYPLAAPCQQPASPPEAAAAPRWIPIADAVKLPLKTPVYVKGKIVSKDLPEGSNPTNRPAKLYVQDASGYTEVIVTMERYARIPQREMFEAGLEVWVFGEVSEYRNVRQITVTNSRGLVPSRDPKASIPESLFMDEPAPAAGDGYESITIGAIDLATIGRRVRIRGNVTDFVPSTGTRMPDRVTVQDPTGEIVVVYWEEVSHAIPEANRPVPGQPIEIGGKVGRYRDKMQVEVKDALMVRRSQSVAQRSQ